MTRNQNYGVGCLAITLVVVVILSVAAFSWQRGQIRTLRAEMPEGWIAATVTPQPKWTSAPAARSATVKEVVDTATPDQSSAIQAAVAATIAAQAPVATPTPINPRELAEALWAYVMPVTPAPTVSTNGSPAQSGSEPAVKTADTATVETQPQLSVGGGQPAMVAAAPTGVDVGNGVLVGGAPASVVPTKYGNGEANSSTCNIPGACWILRDPGVINAENTQDCGENRSCVLVNPDTQFSLTNPTETALCSEGGYLQFSTATATVVVGDRSFTLPRRENHGWVALMRCPNGAPGDNNRFVTFSGYDAGATLVSRYPVPVEAGAFRSEVQTMEEVANAHVSENCGGASDGCGTVGLFLFDTNDGAFTALSHTVEGGWTLLDTNVQ